jgi:hypothetical protein
MSTTLGRIAFLCAFCGATTAAAQTSDPIIIHPTGTNSIVKARTAPSGSIPDQVCLIPCGADPNDFTLHQECEDAGALNMRVDISVTTVAGDGDRCVQATSVRHQYNQASEASAQTAIVLDILFAPVIEAWQRLVEWMRG